MTRPGANDARFVSWRVDGPALNSYADDGDYLGCAHTEDVDCRWDDIMVLSPARNVVNLATHDSGGTLENAHKGITASGASLEWIYILRGSRPAKVRLDTMALVNSGIFQTEVMTDVLATKSANGTYEVTFASDNTALLHVTSIGATTDTTSSNNQTEEFRILGRGAKKGTSQQIIGLGGNAHHQGIYSNILSGSVTMDASAWTELLTLTGDDITFTGFGLDGSFQILGTSKGPYYFNELRLTYEPMFEELRMDESLEHSRIIEHWSFLGAIITFRDGIRWWSSGESASFGLEAYNKNSSPVKGRPTAVCADRKWLYIVYYDDEADDSWLTAWRFRQSGDPGTELIVGYTIGFLDGIACRFLTNVGNGNGTRTNPAIVGGHDGNMFYWVKGRDVYGRWDDAGYTFQTSGTWYGTEWRGLPRKRKNIEFFELTVENCDSDQTVALSVSVDGGTAIQCGATIFTNGLHRLYFQDRGFPVGGQRIKPQVALAGTSTNSPRIRGPIRMAYTVTDLEIDGEKRP